MSPTWVLWVSVSFTRLALLFWILYRHFGAGHARTAPRRCSINRIRTLFRRRGVFTRLSLSPRCCVARLRCSPWLGHEGIVDDPQFAVDGDFAAWTSVFVDYRNVDTSDFELRGRLWSWLHRRVDRHHVSVSIFVLGSRHFDESFAFGGQGVRGYSVDQRCVQSELFHGSYMFGTFGLCSGVAEDACTWAGFGTESFDHGWSQSSGSGNKGRAEVPSGTCLPYFRAPDLPQVSLCEGRGPLGELGSSSGGQSPCRFFPCMTCRVTLKSCIFFRGVWCDCDGCECWSIAHN